LEGYYNSGDIKTTYSYGTRYRWELSLYYQSHVNGYVSSLSNMVLGTKRVCESIARDFFHYLETQGIKSLEAINQEHIINYIVENGAAHMYSMSSFTLALRRLNKYLKKVAAINIPDEIIPFKGKRGRRRVYPSFSNEEMVEILKKTDPNSIEGKRDYAILLLAAYTGLRAIDIARLRLTDINWIDKAVNIIQHKTGVPNCLPLDDIVRAAIADYILNGRPATDSDHVFITTTAPYRKLNDCTSVSNIVEKYMKRAGIQHEPWDGKGFHAIRRRMGVSLLEASVPIEMIAQVLGHTDMDSIKHYLPINIDKLRICALGFEDIPITGGIYL